MLSSSKFLCGPGQFFTVCAGAPLVPCPLCEVISAYSPSAWLTSSYIGNVLCQGNFTSAFAGSWHPSNWNIWRKKMAALSPSLSASAPSGCPGIVSRPNCWARAPCLGGNIVRSIHCKQGWFSSFLLLDTTKSSLHSLFVSCFIFLWPREMLWGGKREGGSCLGTHVRIKDFKI